MSELRLRLSGEDAELGKVPARDVAQLILLVERAVMRAASAVVGRPKTAGGRPERVIAAAARFRLRGIESGSVVPILELPESPVSAGEQTLEVEAATLTEIALESLFAAAEGDEVDPVVAGALLDLTDKLQIGERYESLAFEFRSPRARAPRTVEIDRAGRARLRELVERQEVALREDTLVGTLVEADFEKRTARLRGPFQEAVSVSFPDELADDIHEALRQQATLLGKIAYDPETRVARSVRLQQITRGRQLTLGIDPDEFWTERSITELARAQGVVPATRPEELYDAGASEEERDAFMAALASLAG